MSHEGTAYFAKALEAHHKGMDTVYDFGIQYVRVYHDEFYKRKLHLSRPYAHDYQPNPFRFQYDLCVWLWLNYYKILNEEIAILRTLHNKDKRAGHDNTINEILSTRVLYNIPRADFLWMAAHLRWPTTVLPDGAHHGLFIRDPWAELRLDAMSHESIKYDIWFGGGGQGKTLTALAVALIIFDHFIFTQKGARCMISTVNKDKLNSVAWAYLCNIHSSTEKGISLYAGRARIAGDHTLARPENKDRGGVFKGILIGNSMNPQSIIDKLTGSHGHPFIMYIMDEIQSTPDAPITAAPNFTMHAGDSRIIGSGNWGENNDTLAENCRPDISWDKVDEHTGSWISTTQNGAKAIVLHFNNDLSPGMTDEGHKSYPHLPSKKILDAKYPDHKNRNANNISYRRFWIGFRVKESGDTCVIHEDLVKENLADAPLNLSELTHTFFSFDSAQAEIDRNMCVVCKEGICAVTKQRVFGPHKCYPLSKSTESIKYYTESSKKLLDIAKQNNIKSGSAIVDWTGRPAQAELMQANGFVVRRIVYNKGVPDGIRKDKMTNRIEKEIRLGIQPDFKQDVPADKVCAHHIAENLISLGAWALREYIKAGRVRGINESLTAFMRHERSLEDELYHREFYLKNSITYGSRFQLESKKEFKEKYGFSPEILDCLFQAAYYMLIYRGLPLTPAANDAIINQTKDDYRSDEDEHLEIWEEDLVV